MAENGVSEHWREPKKAKSMNAMLCSTPQDIAHEPALALGHLLVVVCVLLMGYYCAEIAVLRTRQNVWAYLSKARTLSSVTERHMARYFMRCVHPHRPSSDRTAQALRCVTSRCSLPLDCRPSSAARRRHRRARLDSPSLVHVIIPQTTKNDC